MIKVKTIGKRKRDEGDAHKYSVLAKKKSENLT